MKYPFTPEILDALPEGLAELFRGLELTLLQEICSRLKIAGQLNEVTVQNIRALRSHGIYLEDIKAAISAAANTGMDRLDALLDDVAARNQSYYTELAGLAQVTTPLKMVDSEDIWSIYEQTKGQCRNITQSMGFLVRQGRHRVMLPPAKAYQWALDSAELQVMSGTISYNRAIESAVRQLAADGLCVAYDKAGTPIKSRVSYESGHVDHLDVAVRRAVMTGVNQLNAKYRNNSMDILETDLVQVEAHAGARDEDGPNGWENHKKWQGRIYRWKRYAEMHPGSSKGDYPDFEETCGLGDAAGILGANCRHSYTAFLEGVMEPAYSEEYLNHIDDGLGCTFEGRTYTAYEATQKQREIERAIRTWKRLQASYEAAGLEDKATAAKARLNGRPNGLYATYKRFSKAAGLPEQRERMKVLYP